MLKYFIIFFTAIANISFAQNIVEKRIKNINDTSVQINTQNCFLVDIKTGVTDEIKVEAVMSGEYSNDISLNIYEEGKTLFVDTALRPNFEMPNDKLGAHKVISISLKITVPEHMNVQLENTIDVTTQTGAIEVYTIKGNIKADSKYGKITKDNIPNGDAHFNLSSVTGDIHIYKIN